MSNANQRFYIRQQQETRVQQLDIMARANVQNAMENEARAREEEKRHEWQQAQHIPDIYDIAE